MVSRLIIQLTDYLDDHTPQLIMVFVSLCALIFLLLTGLTYYCFHKTEQKVVTVPQVQIETPKGVEIAADKAGYSLKSDQSKQIAHSAKEIYDNSSEPDYTVYTDSNSIKQDSEKARQENKADFALITDPNNPQKRVDVDKLGENTTVKLNQYNIKAYPKVIRQVSYGKKVTTGADVVGAAINWRITKSGKYLGVGVDQSFGADEATVIKLIYSF